MRFPNLELLRVYLRKVSRQALADRIFRRRGEGLTKNKLASVKFPVCFNFQSVSMSLKVSENFGSVSNSLDSDEWSSYSRSNLFAYNTLVVDGGVIS